MTRVIISFRCNNADLILFDSFFVNVVMIFMSHELLCCSLFLLLACLCTYFFSKQTAVLIMKGSDDLYAILWTLC